MNSQRSSHPPQARCGFGWLCLSRVVLVIAAIGSSAAAWAGQGSSWLGGDGPMQARSGVDARAQTAQSRVTPAGSVVARLARTTVPIDETVTLTVTAVNVDGELDTTALEGAFDLVGRSRSSQIEVINGVRRESRIWTLELSPRSVGVFTVPAVTVGGVQSDLQTLEVTDPPVGAQRELFLEVDVDTRTPWVQSQVLLTLRVFDAVDILEGTLSEPTGSDVVVQRLGDDQRSTVERDGRSYSVTERRYALFPQSSGSLVIEPITLNASIPTQSSRVRGFFTPSRRLTRRSDPVTLDVQARPPGQIGWWLPAGALELQGEWLRGQSGDQVDAPDANSPDPAFEATVGVPLTRVLSLRVLGVLQSQLPAIEVPQVDGASLYAETPVVNSGVGPRGIVTEQRLSWAIIPEREGVLELPAVELAWFDTGTGEARTASLSPVRLNVRAAATTTTDVPEPTGTPREAVASGSSRGDAPDVPVADGGSDALLAPALDLLERRSSFWRTAAILAALAWVGTALTWLLVARRARSADRPSNEHADPVVQAPAKRRRALARLRRADLAQRPAALADAALEWGREHWPEDPPTSLTALAARLRDTPAAGTLRRLDAALYRPAPIGDVTGNGAFSRLADELEAAEQQAVGGSQSEKGSLPAL